MGVKATSLLEWDYCHCGHPDKVSQLQCRTETIDSNISMFFGPMKCREQNVEILTCSLVNIDQCKFCDWLTLFRWPWQQKCELKLCKKICPWGLSTTWLQQYKYSILFHSKMLINPHYFQPIQSFWFHWRLEMVKGNYFIICA